MHILMSIHVLCKTYTFISNITNVVRLSIALGCRCKDVLVVVAHGRVVTSSHQITEVEQIQAGLVLGKVTLA